MSSLSGRRLLAVTASAGLALALLALAAWMIFGGQTGGSSGAVQIIPPTEPPAATVDPVVVSDPPAAVNVAATSQSFAVYVTGEVLQPGVYQAESGQRIADLLTMAGGPTHAADLERINLAAYVSDAGHYRIPAVGDGTAAPAADAAPSANTAFAVATTAACLPPIDINAATAACLQILPGIGQTRAAAIVAHRQQAGPFASSDGIVAVPGIGDGIYSRIESLIIVGAP